MRQHQKKGAWLASPGITKAEITRPGNRFTCSFWLYPRRIVRDGESDRALPSLHKSLHSSGETRTDIPPEPTPLRERRSDRCPGRAAGPETRAAAGEHGEDPPLDSRRERSCYALRRLRDVRLRNALPLSKYFPWREDRMTSLATRQGTGGTRVWKTSPGIACILLLDNPRQNENLQAWRGMLVYVMWLE